MVDSINNVNLDFLNDTISKMERDLSSRKMTQSIVGEWNSEDTNKPQFMAKLKSEFGGEVALFADQPTSQGGHGLAPGPIAYCLFGILSCFMATVATVAAMKRVKLDNFKAKISASINLSRVFGLGEEPIIDSIVIETSLKSKDKKEEIINEILKEAEERCPAAYTLKHGAKLIVRRVEV